jgi:hypothetical protein
VAHRLTNNGSDQDGLLPLLDAVAQNTGEMPDEVSADNGFCSEANLEGLVARTVRGYLAAGRASKPGGGTRGGPMVEAMRARLRRGGYRSRYRMRKYVVEPVFGHIKQARGFRQFLLRGIDKVRGEWAMSAPPTTSPNSPHDKPRRRSQGYKAALNELQTVLPGHAPSVLIVKFLRSSAPFADDCDG